MKINPGRERKWKIFHAFIKYLFNITKTIQSFPLVYIICKVSIEILRFRPLMMRSRTDENLYPKPYRYNIIYLFVYRYLTASTYYLFQNIFTLLFFLIISLAFSFNQKFNLRRSFFCKWNNLTVKTKNRFVPGASTKLCINTFICKFLSILFNFFLLCRLWW